MKKGRLKGIKWQKRFSHLRNVVFSKEDFKNIGTKFQIVKFKPNQSVKPHYHKKSVEVFYIISGKGIVRFNGKKHQARKDDYFLCERGDAHEFVNNSDEDLVVLVFRVNEPKDGDIHWKE